MDIVKSFDPIYVLGIRLDLVTVESLHEKIAKVIDNDNKASILNANIHAINLAYRDSVFNRILNSAAIVFCDGVGVKLGARFLGYTIPEVITYDEWIWQLSSFCESQGYSIFLLGGYPGDADKAMGVLKSRFPFLKIVGTHHGFFKKKGRENMKIIEYINSVHPNLLLCSFGMPLQEKWIDENWEKIDANVFLSAGGCIDLVSGRVPSPPMWIQKYGLRWLFRFSYEPRRVFKRYVFGNPLFFYRIFHEMYSKRHNRF